MREIVETFTIDEAMVERFATLTGDRNALHMNAAFARRSRYRQRVAHGMLALGQIARLQPHFPTETLRFRSIQGRFEAPIPLGTTLRLEVMLPPPASGLQPFEASWISTSDGRTVITATGSLALSERTTAKTADADGPACLLLEPETELVRGPEDLVDVTERMAFSATTAATSGLASLMGMGQGSQLCPNLAAILLLSTLVGMRLPGRRATFTSFAMTFALDLEPDVAAVLEGAVTKVSAASETLMADTSVLVGETTLASGEIRALVNPPTRDMLTAETIKDQHLSLGLTGKTVVVIGASRGIGETAAKLFAMHGALWSSTISAASRTPRRSPGRSRKPAARPEHWAATSATKPRSRASSTPSSKPPAASTCWSTTRSRTSAPSRSPRSAGPISRPSSRSRSRACTPAAAPPSRT